MRNITLSRPTADDINNQVRKVLRGLGDPEPPLDLTSVRELLRLDRRYYSTTDDGFLQEMISRMTVAGKQVMLRPSLLKDAVKAFDLRALFIPDRRRILIDSDQPGPKQRWNEAHEVGHSIIPWHADLMLGDQEQTLSRGCHDQIEAEANYAAGQLLFLEGRFAMLANDTAVSIASVQKLKAAFGNTLTTTLWRFVEGTHETIPMVGFIGSHPNPKTGRRADALFRHIIESPTYRDRFAPIDPISFAREVARACGSQRAGPLGAGEITLPDGNGVAHRFSFECFFNGYDCLTLAVYKSPSSSLVPGTTLASQTKAHATSDALS